MGFNIGEILIPCQFVPEKEASLPIGVGCISRHGQYLGLEGLHRLKEALISAGASYLGRKDVPNANALTTARCIINHPREGTSDPKSGRFPIRRYSDARLGHQAKVAYQ